MEASMKLRLSAVLVVTVLAVATAAIAFHLTGDSEVSLYFLLQTAFMDVLVYS